MRIKKLLGRTETRTRDRMHLGRIRSVRDISRDDRARIATCSLRTPTDRLMENYSIDKTAIRPVLKYGSENWALRNAEQNLLERTEMRMFRWMMGIKRIEKIRNEEIRARAGLVW